jgi:hypothetical protein
MLNDEIKNKINLKKKTQKNLKLTQVDQLNS